jgi:hypothetical protein
MNYNLIFFVFFKITFVICDYYDLQMNMMVNSTLDPVCLIESNRKISKMHCICGCNLKNECYTVRFIPDSIANQNCFLYRKYFTTKEMVSSQNSNLYKKHCNPIRTLNDTTCINKRKKNYHYLTELEKFYSHLYLLSLKLFNRKLF